MSAAKPTIRRAAAILGGQQHVSNDDRRRTDRRPCNVPAVLFVPGRSITVGCKMVDESSTGARLKLDNAVVRRDTTQTSVPNEFWVEMAPDKAQVKCRLVWEHDDCVGVRFLSAIQQVNVSRNNGRRTSFGRLR